MSKDKFKRVVRKLAWPLLKLGVAIYAIFLTFLLLFQNKLLYMPSRQMDSTPKEWGLAYEDVFLNADDGVQFHGWYIPCDDAEKVMLFFHGNAGNISHRHASIDIFHRLGVNVLAIDYRGYGKSQGKPSEQGTYRDSRAAWDYLVGERGISPENIIVHGRSLGGAIAAWLARDCNPGALIIESAFSSVPDMAVDLYPFIPSRKLVRFQYDTREYVKSVRCPVLIVHSPNDDIVPYNHGRILYETAKEPKSFHQIEGDHNYGFVQSGDVYVSGVKAFIQNLNADCDEE